MDHSEGGSSGATPPSVCLNHEPLEFPTVDPREPERPLTPRCANPVSPPATDEEVLSQTLERLERYNIRAVTAGPLEEVTRWQAAAPHRIIPAISFLTGRLSGARAGDVSELRRLHSEGRFAVFAEVGAQYEGLAPNDPQLQPYWALAEQLDIPVGIHLGDGPPGAAYGPNPGFRVALGSPLLLESVLVRYPRLRVYVMHAGWPLIDEMMAMLYSHPHVYVDLAGENWTHPRREFHRYLCQLVEAGFAKRILFGSDQMIWPQTIDVAIESIETAPCLAEEQKQAVPRRDCPRSRRLSTSSSRAGATRHCPEPDARSGGGAMSAYDPLRTST
jgi:uncharacterized protein